MCENSMVGGARGRIPVFIFLQLFTKSLILLTSNVQYIGTKTSLILYHYIIKFPYTCTKNFSHSPSPHPPSLTSQGFLYFSFTIHFYTLPAPTSSPAPSLFTPAPFLTANVTQRPSGPVEGAGLVAIHACFKAMSVTLAIAYPPGPNQANHRSGSYERINI